MIANTELAGLKLPEGHAAQPFLNNAEQSMWRARDVISEILDFAGNYRAAPLERVALGEVVASAISEFELRLDQQRRIVSSIAPNLPDVESRRIQIFQILSNLIANGLEALTEGTTHELRVNVDVVTLPSSELGKCLTGQCANLPDRCLRVELKDTGSGMDAETAERIFDPYFSTKGVSRGLGLSSVLGIAKRMNIGLTFDSKVGVGTVFRLYFSPQESAEPLVPNKKVLQASPFKATGKTALVIDDEASVNDVFSDMLSSWGWRVIKAHSGEEAVEAARSIDELDLAFIDVVMPGMNGFKTLEELRKTHPHLPAVLVSGYSENNLPKSCKNDEGVKFLVKPFGGKELRSKIEDLLKSSLQV